jgi:hypothetical protein
MEIILVMIIGSSLLFAGSLVYNSLRESAGAANAKAKVSSLHQLIERVSTQQSSALPSVASIRTEWSRVRADFGASPWGGTAKCQEGDGVNCNQGIREVTVCRGNVSTRCLDGGTVIGDMGVMVYAHYATDDIDPTSFSFATRGRNSFLNTFDHTQKAYVTTSRYAVAAENANGKQFYFVHGPSYVDSGGRIATISISPGNACSCSSTDLSGQVGDPDPIKMHQ